jgi:hypothetical protein
MEVKTQIGAVASMEERFIIKILLIPDVTNKK